MPRAASTTLAKTFSKYPHRMYGGLHMGFWGQEYNSRDILVKKPTSSSLSECILDYLGYKDFVNSFKASSIRNPLTRAISIFNHNSWGSVSTFDQFCYCLKNNFFPNPCARWHAQPMFRHLCIRGSLCVDHLVRVEEMKATVTRLEEKLSQICPSNKRIDSPVNLNLAHHENKSNPKTDVIISGQNKEVLYMFYKEDFEGFGYF